MVYYFTCVCHSELKLVFEVFLIFSCFLKILLFQRFIFRFQASRKHRKPHSFKDFNSVYFSCRHCISIWRLTVIEFDITDLITIFSKNNRLFLELIHKYCTYMKLLFWQLALTLIKFDLKFKKMLILEENFFVKINICIKLHFEKKFYDKFCHYK